MIDLSQSDKYSEIAVVDDSTVLYGSTSSSNDPEVANTCSSASVDPSSFNTSDERAGSCADPALEGRQVLPVFAIDKNLPASTGCPSAVVRIAHVVSQSPGYTLGPVLMTFPALAWSDSAPTWIYGGSDLWLYEWDNPGGIDLMRISATTGAVLQRLPCQRWGTRSSPTTTTASGSRHRARPFSQKRCAASLRGSRWRRRPSTSPAPGARRCRRASLYDRRRAARDGTHSGPGPLVTPVHSEVRRSRCRSELVAPLLSAVHDARQRRARRHGDAIQTTVTGVKATDMWMAGALAHRDA